MSAPVYITNALMEREFSEMRSDEFKEILDTLHTVLEQQIWICYFRPVFIHFVML